MMLESKQMPKTSVYLALINKLIESKNKLSKLLMKKMKKRYKRREQKSRCGANRKGKANKKSEERT